MMNSGTGRLICDPHVVRAYLRYHGNHRFTLEWVKLTHTAKQVDTAFKFHGTAVIGSRNTWLSSLFF